MNPTDPQIEDVTTSTNVYIIKNDKMYVFLYAILVIATFVFIIVEHTEYNYLVIPAIIGFLGYLHVKSKIKKQFTQQFGTSIGFTYSPSADTSSVNGQFFKLGHSPKLYDVLSGTTNGRNSRVFSYDFTIGYGKGSHTYHFTVLETSLPNNLPDIVLSSRTGFSPFTLSSPFGGEHVELEGDFNKYFSLSVPKGYEMETYQIFTPDVMADLIDRAQNLDFEFNANRIYIYAPKLINVRSELQNIFDLAKFLDDLFAQNARAIDAPVNQ
ncbi:MAG: hypothetical protein ACREGC_00655 [Minisyncoccia bacterium]